MAGEICFFLVILRCATINFAVSEMTFYIFAVFVFKISGLKVCNQDPSRCIIFSCVQLKYFCSVSFNRLS